MENLIQFIIVFISIVASLGGLILWWDFCSERFDLVTGIFMACIVPAAFIVSILITIAT